MKLIKNAYQEYKNEENINEKYNKLINLYELFQLHTNREGTQTVKKNYLLKNNSTKNDRDKILSNITKIDNHNNNIKNINDNISSISSNFKNKISDNNVLLNNTIIELKKDISSIRMIYSKINKNDLVNIDRSTIISLSNFNNLHIEQTNSNFQMLLSNNISKPYIPSDEYLLKTDYHRVLKYNNKLSNYLLKEENFLNDSFIINERSSIDIPNKLVLKNLNFNKSSLESKNLSMYLGESNDKLILQNLVLNYNSIDNNLVNSNFTVRLVNKKIEITFTTVPTNYFIEDNYYYLLVDKEKKLLKYESNPDNIFTFTIQNSNDWNRLTFYKNNIYNLESDFLVYNAISKKTSINLVSSFSFNVNKNYKITFFNNQNYNFDTYEIKYQLTDSSNVSNFEFLRDGDFTSLIGSCSDSTKLNINDCVTNYKLLKLDNGTTVDNINLSDFKNKISIKKFYNLSDNIFISSSKDLDIYAYDSSGTEAERKINNFKVYFKQRKIRIRDSNLRKDDIIAFFDDIPDSHDKIKIVQPNVFTFSEKINVEIYEKLNNLLNFH